ncbi:MAG: YbaK/EbsC family protein [Anaerolineae bacterium]|nr:MAG: YbaK/EbsC family protein [Anaerolineae bacterium]
MPEDADDRQETPPVAAALAALGIPHQVFRHVGPLHSLEQAAAERNQAPEQVVRSILFRTGEGRYAMVLVAGPRQISWPALRRFLGQSRLTMASPEEVLAVTGYAIGAVAPFGLPAPIPILLDESVLAQTEVSLGPGVRGVAVILYTADLRRALGEAPVGCFTGDDCGPA